MAGVVQSSLFSYLLLGLGLGACLYLFVTLNHEIRAERRKQHALEAAIGLLSVEFTEVKRALEEAESRTGVLVAPTPPRAGVNLTIRSQALRMYRRGETIQRISAALEVPEQEVELLIKVQQMSLDAPLPEDAPAEAQTSSAAAAAG
ncbi:MAG: hypothetical protein ACLQGV_15220 [Bryobacteraceae bacterium]